MKLGARVMVWFAVLSLAAAACGGEENDAADDGVDDGGVAAETGPTGPTTLYPGPTGATDTTAPTGSTGAEGDVQVSLNNYLFDPNPVEVTSGDTVAVRNGNTRTPHTFTVVGEDVDLELAPLEAETVEITLEPGTYDLICRFHESLEMTGTLVVA